MLELHSLPLRNSITPLIGLGLRHPHYEDVLTQAWDVDFLEVHSENFFSMGAEREYIKKLAKQYPISLHSTALGLGSELGNKETHLDLLHTLIADINPMLISDHASFSFAELSGNEVHVGDLLPIAFNEHSLNIMVNNVNSAQNRLSRTLLIENLSAYLVLKGSTMSECDFLVRLTQLTGCKLLVDLNNLIVNGHNFSNKSPLEYGKDWLSRIPDGLIGEFHLAGFTPVIEGDFAIDDHSQPVSDMVWELYKYALIHFGAVPTLIEWDNQLPSWPVLLQQVSIARKIAQGVCSHV